MFSFCIPFSLAPFPSRYFVFRKPKKLYERTPKSTATDSIATNNEWSVFGSARLADLAVFGVKLATVCKVELPSTHVDEAQE